MLLPVDTGARASEQRNREGAPRRAAPRKLHDTAAKSAAAKGALWTYLYDKGLSKLSPFEQHCVKVIAPWKRRGGQLAHSDEGRRSNRNAATGGG